MSVRRLIEADGIGLAVHFDTEPTAEVIAVFEDLARWIAANPDRIRSVISNAEAIPISEADAAAPAERQLELIDELRRGAHTAPAFRRDE